MTPGGERLWWIAGLRKVSQEDIHRDHEADGVKRLLLGIAQLEKLENHKGGV